MNYIEKLPLRHAEPSDINTIAESRTGRSIALLSIPTNE